MQCQTYILAKTFRSFAKKIGKYFKKWFEETLISFFTIYILCFDSFRLWREQTIKHKELGGKPNSFFFSFFLCLFMICFLYWFLFHVSCFLFFSYMYFRIFLKLLALPSSWPNFWGSKAKTQGQIALALPKLVAELWTTKVRSSQCSKLQCRSLECWIFFSFGRELGMAERKKSLGAPNFHVEVWRPKSFFFLVLQSSELQGIGFPNFSAEL